MANRNDILKELQELNSNLPGLAHQNAYQVPAGYFNELADELLKRVKALEASTAKEELAILSPLLSSIKKETPFTVPAGYFDTIGNTIEQTVLKGTSQEAGEELEELSPLLSSLQKKSTYTVPEGYFENLNPVGELSEPVAKVIPITRRKWVRYAAAAIVIGFVATLGLWNRGGQGESIDPSTKSFAWVEKNLKKVSTDEITEFVESVNIENSDAVAKVDGKDEISNLLKDVSDKEIQDFLNETQSAETSTGDDLILN
jgi:hypothetical protein